MRIVSRRRLVLGLCVGSSKMASVYGVCEWLGWKGLVRGGLWGCGRRFGVGFLGWDGKWSGMGWRAFFYFILLFVVISFVGR